MVLGSKCKTIHFQADRTTPNKKANFHYMYIHLTLLGSDLLGILTSGLTSLTRLGLDVKVDEEKDGEEGAEKDGKVGTELNLKSNSVGGHSLNDGVHGESRGGEGGDRDGSDGGLGGDCGWVRGGSGKDGQVR